MEGSLDFAPVFVDNLALSLFMVILKKPCLIKSYTLIDALSIAHTSFTVLHAIHELSDIDHSISPRILALSITPTLRELTCVNVAIYKFLLAFSMFEEVFELSFVYAS